MKKKNVLMFCVLMSLLILAGCAGKKAEPSSKGDTSGAPVEETLNPEGEKTEDMKFKESIKIGTTNDMPSNAPYGNSNVQTAMLTNSTFSRLVEYDEQYNILPSLAESWESNEDSSEWTFKLRQDVTFHNGEAFTAEDVKFTFEYASSADNEGIVYPLVGYDYVEEIVVVDPYTVTFKLNTSCADWLFYSAQKMMSKATIEREGIENGGCIGTGPYRFVSHDQGVSWNIERFDNYFGEKPVTKEIIFTVITDSNSRSLALESGDVDAIFDPATSDIHKFTNNPKYNVFKGDNLANVFLGLNCSRPAAADQHVRQAIAMAVNRDDIVMACYEGGLVGAPSYNFINNVSPGYKEVEAYGYDVEAAKALLKEAGYDESNRLQLSLYTFGKFMPIAELVQNNLAQANIDVNIKEWAQSSFSANIKADGGYDIYIQQTSSLGGVLNIVQRFFTSEGQSNVMRYYSDALDSLYEEALSSITMDELNLKYGEIQDFLAEDVPAIPVVQTYLWCVGTSDFYGVDLGNQNYAVDFTGCYVIEQ